MFVWYSQNKATDMLWETSIRDNGNSTDLLSSDGSHGVKHSTNEGKEIAGHLCNTRVFKNFSLNRCDCTEIHTYKIHGNAAKQVLKGLVRLFFKVRY